ncbi:MAG: hypothetical protein HUU01_10390 [Saprospiraceae bacterium]|nr:hypothetical protein [Saprospiraceae bacterium]
MNKIQVTDDDFQIIQAVKEHVADISSDEQVVALFSEIFLTILIAPEKASLAVSLLKQPRYNKIREVMKAVWTVGETARTTDLII